MSTPICSFIPEVFFLHHIPYFQLYPHSEYFLNPQSAWLFVRNGLFLCVPFQLERVHINRDARLFGKFCCICRQKSLKYGRIPADFFLKYGKIMLKNPHISFM